MTSQIHKNICKLFHEVNEDEDYDNVSEVIDENLDLESVNTEDLHHFLEEEKEKKRQE